MAKKKDGVVIHYPFVPHYRVPIFNLLAKKLDYDIEVWSSVAAKDRYLKSDDSGWEFVHKRTWHKLVFGRFEVELGIFFRLLQSRPRFYIVLANPNILTSWFYPLVARLIGCKVLFWSHGLLKPEKGLKRALLWLYYRIPHGLLLYGERTKPWLMDLGVDGGNLHAIYNSLDYSAQVVERDAQSCKLAVNGIQLVVMGRLLRKLKIDQLIEFLSRYNSENPSAGVSLIVVGDGPERESLMSLACSLGVSDSVVFKGAVYNEAELAGIYCSSSACVIMGIAGLAVMHSLAYGTPVITHNDLAGHCPEVEALLGSSAGIFFESNDFSSFAKAINSLGDESDRSEQAIQVIEAKYTPEAQLEYIKEALNAYQ